jgi:hypothetical protein
MPLVFYKQQDELVPYFGQYLGANNWNSPAVITDAPQGGPNTFAMTEEGIIDTFMNKASQFAKTDKKKGENLFYDMIRQVVSGKQTEYTVYVLKGIHTKPEQHFTVALAGQLWHMNVERLGSDNTRFAIHTMSGGGKLYDDPEWTVKK